MPSLQLLHKRNHPLIAEWAMRLKRAWKQVPHVSIARDTLMVLGGVGFLVQIPLTCAFLNLGLSTRVCVAHQSKRKRKHSRG